jgi:hypothetical protein
LDKYVTIIHDKMDHAKIASPYFASKNKSINAFMRLLVVVTSMIAHGYGDGKYDPFLLDLYLCNSNHTVGSAVKLLCDLQKPPASSLGILFENSRTTPLFATVLCGNEVVQEAAYTYLSLLSI